MFNIPTYEEALKICEKSNKFYEKRENVRGYTVSVFNYRLANYKDFFYNDAFELRGLTFVHDNAWPNRIKRYIMLHKFFNLNQTTDYMGADVIDKEIVMVQEKVDGSMMRFIRLPNGEVVAKTKMGFNNEQCVAANKMVKENEELEFFVNWSIDAGIAAIFEYISPFNRIVLRHTEEKMKLLQLRDENTGEYFSPYTSDLVSKFVSSGAFELAELVDPIKSLNQYVNEANWKEDTEGVVIRFSDGQMMKVKTKWYCALHRLLTDEVDKENFIVRAVLDEKIDDVIAQLDVDDPVRDYVESLSLALCDYIIDQTVIIANLVEKYSKKNNRRAFFMLMANETYSNVIMHAYEAFEAGNDMLPIISDSLDKSIRKSCFRLEKAKEFIEKEVGFKTRRMIMEEE
jgi:T4 RnlA family RNA ligase